MFCLFRNSRIVNPLNYFVLAISWMPVLYWLHFAFIEKSFVNNYIEGSTLMVDLLLGLPIVLLFAIVIYAMFYWFLKIVVITFAPYMIEKNTYPDAPEDNLDESLQEKYGEDYWDKEQPEDTTKQTKNSKDKTE